MIFGFRLTIRSTVAALTLVVIAGAVVMLAENAHIRDGYLSERRTDL